MWHACGETRNAYNTSVGKPQGERSLHTPRRRLEDNITINFKRNIIT
jgi:hypothetical protein